MSIGIGIEHPVAHVHIQNELAESFIKRIKLVATSLIHLELAESLIMRCKLPVSAWGHAILHVATLICIKSTSYHTSSLLQLFFE